MINITVGSFKGGVGKSTVSLNFAYELSKYGKVLLVDTDPQNSLAFFLCQEFDKGFSEILFMNADIDNLIKKPFPEDNNNFHFLPTGVYGINNPTYYEDEFSLDKVERFLKLIKNFDFEYIVYDTPPRISKHIETLIQASEDFLLVLTPDPATYSSFVIFLKFLEENNLKEKVLCLTNQTEPTKISEDFTKLISLHFKKRNLGFLPRDLTVIESQGKCRPTVAYNSDCPFSIFLKKAVLNYLKLKT
ncbi:ParA family protein [Sulfurihydrogenibium sp.]|uniref:ParA family protein n=1 Tax=Sulfurihydrogenibium sp. TaxID=2053621 RepID=UPI00262531C7|nr:ParA family protein [Sulfurihydrogenibium sp.]